MLIPLIITNEEIDSIVGDGEGEGEELTFPSKTYKMDFTTGEIFPVFIDHDEAIRQAVIKTVLTARDRYLIYTTDFGCEIRDIIGKLYSKEYLDIEVPRLINEAVLVDDRVEETTDYEITVDGTILHISFRVVTTTGDTTDIEVEVAI